MPNRYLSNPIAKVCVLIVASAVTVAAQQPLPSFDVVSIRRSQSDDTGGSAGTRPGGRYVLVNAGILALVGAAYPTDSSEYIGGPDWLRTDRYDVTAVGQAGVSEADMQAMLRGLLAERFNFKGHYEMADRPVYNLVPARANADPSPALRKVDVDCEARRAANLRGEKVAELPRRPNGQLPCGYGMRYADSAQIIAGGITMATFARTLQGPAGRAVVDKTGLGDNYEFTLSFTEKPAPDSDAVDVFTAVQEQLGLRLVPARGSVRVFVVDQIDRPRDN